MCSAYMSITQVFSVNGLTHIYGVLDSCKKQESLFDLTSSSSHINSHPSSILITVRMEYILPSFQIKCVSLNIKQVSCR